MIYRFGSFSLDLERGALRGPEGDVHLRHQAFKLLVVLVEEAPNILAHDQLLDRVWGMEHLSASSLKQAISEVRQALGDDPSNPAFVETVHRRGYRFIAPVEIVDRKLQTRDSSEVEVETAIPKRPRTQTRLRLGLVALVFVVGGSVLLWMQGRQARAVPARQSIAVIGFDVLSDDPDLRWTSEFVARTLVNELRADAALRVVPADRVAEARRELRLRSTEAFDPETVRNLGRILGVDSIAVGTFAPGNEARPSALDLTIDDVDSGRPELTLHRSASPGDFVGLTAGIGAELRKVLNPPVPTWGELPRSTPRPISTNPEAQRLFVTGVKRMRIFDTLAAVDALERAAILDADSPEIRWRLAQALLFQGNQVRAAEVGAEALALARNLPREQQLAIEAFSLEAHQRWDEAAKKYAALHEFIPDTIDYPLRRAMCLINGGRAADALPIFAELHRMPPEINGDPRIALTESKVLSALGRSADAETAASAAVAGATETGAAVVKAAALRERAWARLKRGDRENAISDLESSRDLFSSFGHLSGEGGALSGLAALYLENGDSARARDLYTQAGAVFEEIGELRAQVTVLYNLAALRANSGDYEGSRDRFMEVLALKQKINDVQGQAHVYDALAQLDRALGNDDAAMGWLTQARRMAEETGDRILEGRTVRTRAEFAREAGDLDRSRADFDSALTIFRQIDNPLEEGRTLESMAQLEIESGSKWEAATLLESAVECYRHGSFRPDLVSALRTLGRTRINLGREDQGRVDLEEALELARSLENEELAAGIEQELQAMSPPTSASEIENPSSSNSHPIHRLDGGDPVDGTEHRHSRKRSLRTLAALARSG